jgi:hypothetical protein
MTSVLPHARAHPSTLISTFSHKLTVPSTISLWLLISRIPTDDCPTLRRSRPSLADRLSPVPPVADRVNALTRIASHSAGDSSAIETGSRRRKVGICLSTGVHRDHVHNRRPVSAGVEKAESWALGLGAACGCERGREEG